MHNPVLLALKIVKRQRFPTVGVIALARFIEECKDEQIVQCISILEIKNWFEEHIHDEFFDEILETLKDKKGDYKSFQITLAKYRNNPLSFNRTAIRKSCESLRTILSEGIQASFKNEYIIGRDIEINEVTPLSEILGTTKLWILEYKNIETLDWIQINYGPEQKGQLAGSTTKPSINLKNFEFEIIDDLDQREIQADGTIRCVKRRTIKSLRSKLERIEFEYKSKISGMKTGYFDFDVELTKNAQYHGRKNRINLRKNVMSPFIVSYSIEFEPPLAHGEEIEYELTEEYFGLFSISYEQKERMIEEGKFAPQYSGQIEVPSGRKIASPTRRMKRIITFDSGYEIDSARFNVRLDGNVVEEELKKLIEENAFIHKKVEDKHTLELLVNEPLLAHRYEILWVPPSQADVDELLKKTKRKARVPEN